MLTVSMMRRDAQSDKLGNKCTSSVKYPGIPHATIYGIGTMLVALAMIYPLLLLLGSTFLAYLLCLTTAVIAAINTVLGAEIDHRKGRSRSFRIPRGNTLMLRQVGASMVMPSDHGYPARFGIAKIAIAGSGIAGACWLDPGRRAYSRMCLMICLTKHLAVIGPAAGGLG
jgi:hypothetical protein